MGRRGKFAGVLFGLVVTGLFVLAACSGAVAPAPQEKPASDEVDAACPRPVLSFRASPSVRCGDHVCEGAKPVCCGQGLRGDATPEEPVCAASRDACQFRQPGSVVVCDDDEDCPDACCQEGSPQRRILQRLLLSPRDVQDPLRLPIQLGVSSGGVPAVREARAGR